MHCSSFVFFLFVFFKQVKGCLFSPSDRQIDFPKPPAIQVLRAGAVVFGGLFVPLTISTGSVEGKSYTKVLALASW